MLKITRSNRFVKDLRTAIKRGIDLQPLKETVDTLARGETLGPQHRDHTLAGVYSGFRECHVKNDWLLIYRIEQDELELFLFRTGTHSDLFR